MNRIALLAAAGVALSSVVAHAGFSMTDTRTSIDATHDRIDLTITNTGGATGSKIVALTLGGYGIPAVAGGSAKTSWNLLSSGKGSVFDYFGSPTASGLAIDTNPNITPSAIYQSPTTWGTGSNVGLNDWGVVWFSGGSPNLLNNNTVKFASLVVDKGAGMHFDVGAGGGNGNPILFNYDVAPVGGAPALDLLGTGPQLFGSGASNSFFIHVGAGSKGASLNPDVAINLVGDLQQSTAKGLTITPVTGGLMVNTAGLSGGNYELAFRATDPSTGATTVESLLLTRAVPEPASLAAITGIAAVFIRRRRAI